MGCGNSKANAANTASSKNTLLAGQQAEKAAKISTCMVDVKALVDNSSPEDLAAALRKLPFEVQDRLKVAIPAGAEVKLEEKKVDAEPVAEVKEPAPQVEEVVQEIVKEEVVAQEPVKAELIVPEATKAEELITESVAQEVETEENDLTAENTVFPSCGRFCGI